MKRIRCPKCDEPIVFDETIYAPGRILVFECPECRKQFRIRIPGSAEEQQEEEETIPEGVLTVIENAFHFKQELPLHIGENIIGRYVKGTSANLPIKTTDPSVDTTHCIVTVSRTAKGKIQFELRDAGSSTGTFYMSEILGNKERVRMEDGAIVTIGATTMVFHPTEDKQ